MEQAPGQLIVNVKSTSVPSKQAGFIHKNMNERNVTDIRLRCLGAASCYQALKVVLSLNNYIAYQRKACSLMPTTVKAKENENVHEEIVLFEFHLKFHDL